MKRLFPLLILGLLLLGCVDSKLPDPKPPVDVSVSTYKDIAISTQAIPETCKGKTDCDLFSCMISSCWCKSQPPEGGIVFRANKTIADEANAKAAVVQYLGYSPTKSFRAVKLNPIFYNVFYEDSSGDEKVLTVAIDGTIMETMCGV